MEEVLTKPLLCIEVFSPGDRTSRWGVVLADYLAMGVANIWFIDPVRRAVYTFGHSGLQEANPANVFILNTPIHLDLTPAFAKLDRKTKA